MVVKCTSAPSSPVQTYGTVTRTFETHDGTDQFTLTGTNNSSLCAMLLQIQVGHTYNLNIDPVRANLTAP